MDVDVLIEITGVADFAGDGDQVRQRLGNGFRGVEGDEQTCENRGQRPQRGQAGSKLARRCSRFRGVIEGLCDIDIRLIENG